MKRIFSRLIKIVAIVLILVGKVTMAEISPENDLFTLAKNKFGEVSSEEEKKAFEEFFQKTQDGERADLTPQLSAVADPRDLQLLTDPVNANLWGKERVIQARWINWLCNDPKAFAKVTSRGVNIAHAKIVGKVDLAWAKMPFPFRASRCAFTDDIILDWCSLRGLELDGTYIKSLHGESLTAQGTVDMLGLGAKGPVFLQNAAIDGLFLGRSAHFSSGPVVDGPIPAALDLRSAKIASGVDLANAKAEGSIWLGNAEIKGSLRCENAQIEAALGGLHNTGGQQEAAISGFSMKIAGDVLFSDRFTANGPVVISGSAIQGSLDCSGGQFRANGSYALNAELVTIGGSVFLTNGFAAQGIVSFRSGRITHDFVLRNIDVLRDTMTLDMRYANVGTLFNEKRSWPHRGRLFLYGFVYDRIDLTVHPDAKTQVQWLHTQQPDPFLSQPYQQLSATLRSMGFPLQAEDVLIAEKIDEGRSKIGQEWRAGRVAPAFFNFYLYNCILPLFGYGYRPFRPLMAAILVVLIGQPIFMAAYRRGLIMPTHKDASVPSQAGAPLLMESYPKFNALLYSLDMFVPLLSLGIAEYWAPNANAGNVLRIGRLAPLKMGALLRCYLWFHVILGWIFVVSLFSIYPETAKLLKEMVKM